MVGRASGRIQDVAGECQYNFPRDVYFIGNLRPRPDDPAELINEPTYMRELRNKLAPVAFGADFRILPVGEQFSITVKVSWDCYYRVFPTWEQQVRHQLTNADDTGNDEVAPDASQPTNPDNSPSLPTAATANQTAANQVGDAQEQDEDSSPEEQDAEEAAEEESPEASETPQDRRRTRRSRDSLFIRFRKIPCAAAGRITLRLTGGEWVADVTELQAALDEETARARQIAVADPEAIRGGDDPASQITIPETALASESDFEAFLATLTTLITPEWRWEANVVQRPSDGGNPSERVLQFSLMNCSPTQSAVAGAGSSRHRDNPNIEPYLFDAQIHFYFDGATVLPFELELAPRGFRYNRELWGRGFNCAVERYPNSGDYFSTTHTPMYRQMRYATRSNPSATFSDLSSDPLPTLGAVDEAMTDYLSEWDEQRTRFIENDPGWEEQFGQSYEQDRLEFEREITEFRRGCDLIRDNPDVLLAFKLTNETFRRVGDHPLLPQSKRKLSWRLFQIVFLVSQIPGIAALANPGGPDSNSRERVDIIYFPTGGGKTEAYLATLIFHCFFDRLRGKTAGVTAWTRFPLRLLTLQQTQRVADVIGVAELVRREQSDRRLSGQNIAGFAVGYFVGKEATPNEIINADTYQYAKAEDRPTWSKANDEQRRQEWKRVVTCPSCRTNTVRVDFDPNSIRVIHRCSQEGCAFPKGRLPIYVVDNEVFRYLPCVIVGTIDKLASLGNQRKLALVFGQVDGKCDRHGYYKGRCSQKDCRNDNLLKTDRPSGLSGPTLFIQDELHLLKEGLGTFDAHYETFTQRLQNRFGQTETLKIIASSATIEAFARQVEHLYGRRQATVFPGLGPTLAESFYAQTKDYPQRLYLGLLPHNKTIFNSILELIELYHRTLQVLQGLGSGSPSPYGGTVSPGTDTWYSLLDPYVTSLTYFRANRDLDSIRTDIRGDVIPNLERDGFLPIETRDLTGGTSTEEVTRVLERLEQAGSPERPADAVLATNMISHGVDVDRFNAMIFYGMPSQTAEYIQSSSRVGRAHVGVVFVCLHPARERDQSHYAYFSKYHEFVGQLIEPVAINRWAKFSLKRTIPGLFMGVLLQLLSNSAGEARNGGKYYTREYVRQKIASGSIQADQFIPLLEEAYLVNSPTTDIEMNFRAEITQRVRLFLDQIVTASASARMVSDALIPKPMFSLRDVDEALVIELDAAGEQWAS
jgi:hypothetical protein